MNGRKKTQRETEMNSNGGFTLIELILVTVIIAILAGMVSLSFQGKAQQARVNAALGDIKSYESAIELFALENNDNYPKSLKDLVDGDKKYIRELNKDPWGNPYVYLSPGDRHRDSFDIYSMGRDGTEGTEDDVAPWLMDKEEE